MQLLLFLLVLSMSALQNPKVAKGFKPFTVGTYNVSGVNRPGALARIRVVLRNPRLVFMGFQEGKWLGREKIPASLRALGWKRPRRWQADTQAWYRNFLGMRFVNSGIFVLAETANHWIEPDAAGPTKADLRRINWIEGRQRGRKVIMGSLHLVPSIHLDKADALSEAQVASICSFVSYWKAHGYEVILVGDFNMPPGHPNLRPLLKLNMTVVNKDDGWTHSKGTVGTRRLISLVVVTSGIVEIDSRTIFGHRKDDHRIVLSRLAFKAGKPRKSLAGLTKDEVELIA